MAVWTQMPLGAVFQQGRWDAEYFQPAYLAIATKLASSENPHLGTLALLTCSAFYPSATDSYQDSGIPFIRCVDVNNHPMIHGDQPFERLPAVFVRAHKSIRTAQPGDVVISKVGSPCFASILDDSVGEAALTRTVLALSRIRTDEANPYYLVAFLRSKYGFFQLLREREQQIQLQLTLDRVRKIRVFLPHRQFQDEIGALIKDYGKTLNRAKGNYSSAQRILEEQLQLGKIDLSHCVGYQSHLSQIIRARRWDSEFYKPKYQRVMDRVLRAKRTKVAGFIPVGRLISYLTNGQTPLHHDLGVGEVHFLTAEHVSDFRVDFGTDKRILRRHHETELVRTALRNGDVLVTIKGKVGNCAVVRDCPEAANINQDLALIRLRKEIHPYLFAGWFNSLMGKQLVEQRSTGGINPFLGLGNLRGMPFPILDPEEHRRIGKMIQQTVDKAYAAERGSSVLLEQAKRRVEELIEQKARK